MNEFDRVAVTVRVAFVSLAAVLVGSLAGALVRPLVRTLPAAYAYGVRAGVASLVIGAVGVAAAVSLRGGVSFFDFDRPSLHGLGLGVLGGLVMLVMLWVFSVVTTALGVPSASHGIVARIRETPVLALVMVVVSVVAIAPGEELLARGFVQKALYDVYSRDAAVVVSSAVFASVHLFAYATAPAPAVAAALTQLFAISLVLGWLYARTRNLVVPMVAHALYDAVQFLYAYTIYAGV